MEDRPGPSWFTEHPLQQHDPRHHSSRAYGDSGEGMPEQHGAIASAAGWHFARRSLAAHPYNEGVGQGVVWEDQWARILRWRERVRQARDDWRTDAIGTEGYRDEVFALFQAIWHLKDWLKNDPQVTATAKASVERWVTMKGDLLKVAADVANGSKHMSVAANRARSNSSNQTRNDVRIHVGRGIQHTFYVTDARTGTDHEAVDLADRCLDEWAAFLAREGMRRPMVW